MKGRWLLVPAVFLLIGCNDNQPTGLKVPTDASEIIRDGAHGGNADFFFLPPLVPLAYNHPDFELGKFNNALRPSMRIEICELRAEHLTTAAPAGLPTDATRCVAGAPLKTFPAGTINVVNLPKRQWGWWSLFNLPPDGFYYALWNTKQSNLNRDKFYRIKVLLEGSTVPLGVADIDPMPSLRDWRNARTGEVVQMIDDILLPIPFRVEKGIACNGALLCNSATVTNDNPDGDYQIVRVEGNDGAIAGVLLPDNWLPEDGPQSVVFTITRVNTGVTDVANGTQSIPCHLNLPLQQFDGCFNFSTTPALATIPGTPGHQFTRAITVVTCIVLPESDPRFPFLQLWSSDPGEPAKPLETASDAIVMTTEPGRSCANTPVIGSTSRNGFVRFASAGWHKLTGGVNKLFGVKTAYAVDLGIGGLTFDLSNIGPALSANIQRHTATGLTLPAGGTTTATARLVGTQTHHGEIHFGIGIAGLPVTFSVAPGHGALRAVGSEGPPSLAVTVITNSNPIDHSPTSGGGFAPVNWTMPVTPGTYTLTATGPAFPDTVTFTATVQGASLSGVATATNFACAILEGGLGSCWGANSAGQLGNGSNTPFEATPVPVAGNLTFTQISATDLSACGITVQYAAYCWGSNGAGLGDGTTRIGSNIPVPVAGNHSFRSIAAGSRISCALTESGKAFCWGRLAAGGGLGDGVTTESNVPIEVALEQPLKSITVGFFHACALDFDGHAYCWGDNQFGPLGAGDNVSRLAPVAVLGGHTFTSLTAGNTKSCGVANGVAWCWGFGFYGELGNGSTIGTSQLSPVRVVGTTVFQSVIPGSGNDVLSAACGIATTGLASCWGANSNGQLGGANPQANCSLNAEVSFGCTGTPQPVQGDHIFRELAVGAEFACGIAVSRQIFCWGANTNGQLGNGTTTSTNQPTPVSIGLLAR